MTKYQSIFFFTSLSFAQCSYAASDHQESRFGKFDASAELGYVMTASTSKSDSKRLIFKTSINNQTENFRHDFRFSTFFRQDEEKVDKNDPDSDTIPVTKSEKYFASLESTYLVSKDGDGIPLFMSYETDRINKNYAYQASVATGYNYKILDSEVDYLEFSVGPGYAFDKLKKSFRTYFDENDNEVEAGDQNVVDSKTTTTFYEESRKEFILRAAATYKREIAKNVNFNAGYSVERSAENIKTKLESAITMKVNGSLAVKASLVSNQNTNSGNDQVNKDKINSVTLVYKF
ncbi:YdiY family protein [Catenovulum maritimum]|uniref:DUF481 domain-containing protein n=1 Tax=Catenovulum maritimum TaxID=1513271 RepID=UPI00066090EE|nr:DUF481 domain-containing protein [Catenovulum maritimum]